MRNDGTDLSVDRYAIGGQLPCEVERIQSWLHSNIESMTGESSDWPEEERAQMRPGCKVLLEIIDGEAEDALAEYEGLQSDVTTDPLLLLERRPSYYRARFDVERDQDRWRSQIRAALRGYLRETVDIARALGVNDAEVADLLAETASPAADHLIAQVIPMAARRRSLRRR